MTNGNGTVKKTIIGLAAAISLSMATWAASSITSLYSRMHQLDVDNKAHAAWARTREQDIERRLERIENMVLVTEKIK